MKKFRELHIDGLKKNIDEFRKIVSNVCGKDWKYIVRGGEYSNFVIFEYTGKKHPKARVFVGAEQGNVCNIVPIEIGQLTIGEYNHLLEDLYTNILKKLENKIDGVDIGKLESDECDLKEIFGIRTLEKLKIFCNNANKGTGSADPNDRELWFNFVHCSYVESGRLSTYYLGRALIEEFGWSIRLSEELVDEYLLLTDYIEYCEKIDSEGLFGIWMHQQ